jgi:STE24 endopeptidase
VNGRSLYRRLPADPRAWFSEAEIARAAAYRRPLRVAGLAESGVGAAGLVLAVALRGAGHLLAWTGAAVPAARVLLVVTALVLAATVLDLPFSAWRLAYERRWGFSHQSGAGWAVDRAKGAALSVVFAGALALGLWALVRNTADWWLWAWVALSVLSVLLVMVAPAVLAPLFNRFRPLEDQGLRSAALDLGRRLGVPISEVLVMDASRRTAKHNAYVTGLGRTTRVVVWDTLLADYEAPATIAVLAHELGHWRRHHVQRLLGISAAVMLPGLFALHGFLDAGWVHRWTGIAGASDPRAVPVSALALVVAQTLWLPVAGWVSRAFERQADADAVALIPDPGPFVAMMRDLAVRNLSDLAPTRWGYLLASHPPAAERMAAACPAKGR